jgi:hypothetical protein
MKTLRPNRVLSSILSVVAVLTGSAYADSLTFTFETLPADGAISGAPGLTIGWGYTITNLDQTNWLETTALNADLFQQATPNASLFDLPIIAPGATVTGSYTPGLSGLYELTWDVTAPGGFVNSGSFILSGDWYDGDPLSGGAFIGSAIDQSTPYSATVSPGLAPVPEPSTSLLLALAIGSLVVRRQLAVPAPTFLRRRAGD